jgi:hypothetical protein
MGMTKSDMVNENDLAISQLISHVDENNNQFLDIEEMSQALNLLSNKDEEETKMTMMLKAKFGDREVTHDEFKEFIKEQKLG